MHMVCPKARPNYLSCTARARHARYLSRLAVHLSNPTHGVVRHRHLIQNVPGLDIELSKYGQMRVKNTYI